MLATFIINCYHWDLLVTQSGLISSSTPIQQENYNKPGDFLQMIICSSGYRFLPNTLSLAFLWMDWMPRRTREQSTAMKVCMQRGVVWRGGGGGLFKETWIDNCLVIMKFFYLLAFVCLEQTLNLFRTIVIDLFRWLVFHCISLLSDQQIVSITIVSSK